MKSTIKQYQFAAALVVLCGLAVYANRGFVDRQQREIEIAPVKTTATPATVTVASPAASPQPGGSFDIPSSVISAGGETSTGGALSLTGIIGQSVVGSSDGGSFSLSSGFLTSSLPDLRIAKSNDVDGSIALGSTWTWKLHIDNANSTTTFASGQTILSDNLPNININYGAVSVSTSGATGTITCNIDTNDLNCVASGAVSINPGGSVDIQFQANPSAVAVFGNPRSGGICSVDPGGIISESDETNNTCSDSVTVTAPVTAFTEPSGNCGVGKSPCFTSIQTAANTVAASGTVSVAGGNYNESLNLNSAISVDVNADISITGLTISNGTLNSGSSTISVTGDWTNNSGTFNAGSGTINLNGSSTQSIGGSASTTFNNLTINNSSGPVTMSHDEIVNGVLTLTHDLDAGGFTLTMPNTASSAGSGDVTGNVRRTGFVNGGPALSFGNPFNQISISGGPALPVDITVKLTKTAPTDSSTGQTNSGFPNAVQRTYVITPNIGGFTASVQLHYLLSELNGNTEASLNLWRFNSSTGKWENKGSDSIDTTNHAVKKTGITEFSPWTLNSTIPTSVEFEDFNAIAQSNGVMLKWRTGFEVNNLGFNIYRQQNGERVQINPSLVAGSALMVGSNVRMEAGNSYTWIDDVVDLSSSYWLEDVDLDGTSTWHGPFDITGSTQTATATKSALLNNLASNHEPTVIQREYAAGFDENAISSQSNAQAITNGRTPTKASLTPVSLRQQWSIASRPALKIAVNKTGWFHVSVADLMAAGLDPSATASNLQMFVGGVEIPIRANSSANQLSPSDSIEFYGAALDTPTTDTQIYWLLAGTGTGKRINVKSSMASGNSDWPKSFRYTVERKDRSLYFSSLRNGDAENWFGSVITSKTVSETISISNHDTNSIEPAQLEVGLQGVTTNAHQVRVMLNGQPVDTMTFYGMDHSVAKIQIPQSSLIDGENQIAFVSENSGDVSLIDYVRVTYARAYIAQNNFLSASLSQMPIKITGFTSGQIRAVDVANANAPVEIEGKIDAEASNYSISFGPAKQHNLLVFTADRMLQPLSITANQPSTLNKGGTADFVIITQKDLAESIKPFASFKQSQGYRVALIDVEDIYDEFSFGTHTPQAVKDFLNWTYLHWQTQPQYVLLAGSGSLDPKNYIGVGNTDLVPIKLIDTSNMETASDDWFVDFDNDGKPEMSIGRLPVRNSADANNLINKIIGYEQSGKADSVVLVSDISDNADFNSTNKQIKSLIPSLMNVTTIVRGQPNTDARSALIDQFLQGGKIVNYAGHGSVNLWRGNLLTSSDAALLINQKISPMLITMTCLNAYFIDPRAASLGESLVRVQQGGFASVWASTAMTGTSAQVVMDNVFFNLVLSNPDMTIGQAIKTAKNATEDMDVRRSWVLFGDPTMKIKR